jgi:hypothetical protein
VASGFWLPDFLVLKLCLGNQFEHIAPWIGQWQFEACCQLEGERNNAIEGGDREGKIAKRAN